MRADLTQRPCLRCLGAGKVARLDGGALAQPRDQDATATVCPECRGSRVIQVGRR